MSEATLKVKIAGDSAEFQRSLKEGLASAREFGTELASRMREAALQVTGVVLGVETLGEALEKTFEGIKGVFELSKELEHLSDRTGIATKDLVLLRTEFQLSGLGADQVGTTINRMQRSIENAADKGGEAASVFSRLGLNMAELQRMNPAQQFEAMQKAISGIADPARRAQVAMQIFGRQGAEMLALFNNKGAMGESQEALGQQADILARNSEIFNQIAGDLEAAGIKVQGFFVGLAEPISRVILPVLKELMALDLTKWGENIGTSLANAVRVLYNAFEQGKFGELVGAATKYGLAEGLDYFAGGLETAIKALGNAIPELFDSKLWEGLKDGFTGVADSFIGAIMSKLPEIMLGFKDIADHFKAWMSGQSYGAYNKEHQYDDLRDYIIDQMAPLHASGGARGQMSAYAHQRDYVNDLIQQFAGGNQNASFTNAAGQQVPLSAIHQTGWSLAGSQGDQWSKAGDALIGQAGTALTSVGDKIGSAFEEAIKSSKPDRIINTDDLGKNLSNLINQLGTALPGEGEANAPESGIGALGGGDNGRFGDSFGLGIHRDDNGQWHSYNGPGGIAGFGMPGEGSAGRAGIMAATSPDPNDPMSQMAADIASIQSMLSTVTEPA
jgi:hypothetical protein